MSSVSEIDKDELVATKAWDTSLFKRLLGYARPHAKLFLASFGVLLLIFGGEVLGTEIWRRTIDGPVTEAATATDKAPFVREMVLLVGAYLGLIAFMVVLRYFETSMLIRTGQAVVHDLRASVFRHIQGLDLGFFDSRPTGALVTRVTTDIENLSEMFTSGVVSLLFDLVKVVVVLGLLFAINAQLALITVLTTPLLIGVSLAFRGGARRAHREVRARLARLNGYLQEVLSGIRVVQVFRREERVSDRFDEALAKYFKANKRTIFLFALFYPSMSLAVYVIQGTALWAGVRAIVGGELTYGEFVQFWLLLAMLVRPIRELGERYNVLQSAFASAERLFQILDTAPAVATPPAPSPLPSPAGTPPHVRFEDVRFSYVEDSEILRGVSFEIPPGKTVAVVGATGAGKSTLVNLLLRYYDVDAGRISMDGVDLRELPIEDVRGRFGLVLQEDFLFEGSVRENLVMEREGVSEPSLGEALSAAQATDLVARLDGGLEAQVAERGATFSGGERQLLAIARALAARPDLVVLDEATAAVDSATEHRIELATKELLEGRSALVIAHRLSTIRDADEILVMARGEIRERGTHDELLAKGGLYAKLHALQFEGAAAAG
ncbi:MAG: ABC transporter ATP-binding protein [Planctomycetota bacterium]